MAGTRRAAGAGNGTKLVIVESPTKARMIGGFLGPDYVVEASIGHIRDLPRNAADVPAKYKGEKWARTGVDVDHGFEPLYVVNPDKKSTIRSLKDALREADELLLATDDDREGEAIAWHLETDDAFWERMHAHFSEPELVELGCAIALTLGQQSWLRMLNIDHHQVMPGTSASMAPGFETREDLEATKASAGYWAHA